MPLRGRTAVWSVIAAMGFAAVAAAAPAVPAAEGTALVENDKELVKELAKGDFLGQLEARRRLPKTAYVPPPKKLKPYASASLGAPIAYALVEGKTRFVDAPAARAYAQSVVDRLLAAWPGPKQSVPVHIGADPSYGAEAIDAGIILVSIGTFNADPGKGAATGDELALMLAHELGHILLDHFEDRRTMQGVVDALGFAASAFTGVSSVRRTTIVNDKVVVKGDDREAVLGVIGGLAATALIEELLSPGFGRKSELEADRFGIDLARRAGYVITDAEVRNFIQKHGQAERRRAERTARLLVVLRAIATTAFNQATRSLTGDTSKFTRGLYEFLSEKLADAVVGAVEKNSKSHPDPAQRLAFDAMYLAARDKALAASDTVAALPRRDTAGLRGVSTQATFANLLTQIRAADEWWAVMSETPPAEGADTTPPQIAAMLRRAGYTAGAAPRARPPRDRNRSRTDAVRPAPAPAAAPRGFGNDAAAFTLLVEGIVLETYARDAAGAQRVWRRGLRSPYATVDMARRFGTNLQATKALGDVAPLVDRYTGLIGTSEPILDLVVAAAVAKGDMAAAEAAAARCVTYERGALYTSCTAFLGYDPMGEGGAKTPEGKKAFAMKGMERSFEGVRIFFDLF